MSHETKSLRHYLFGTWVVTFLLFGLCPDLHYVVYQYDLHALNWLFEGIWWSGDPQVRYLAVGLVVGIGLIALAPRPLTGLGTVRLTMSVGFFIILFNYGLDLFDGRYGLFSRGSDIEVTWLEQWISARIEYPSWVGLVTYVSLGYLLVRRKGLRWAFAVSAVIALADSLVGWLVLRLYILRLVPEAMKTDPWLTWAKVWEDFTYGIWAEVLALLMQASILSFFGFLGAMLTQVRWPDLARRLFPKKYRRYRPNRRIAPRRETG